ncbi:MAG: hypothetical protein ACM3PP_00050 [Candidatus Saccharibacteria bacterium]
MKIQENDLFHGAVLTQIAQYNESVRISKINDKIGCYLIDNESLILIKYRTPNMAPWSFRLSEADRYMLMTLDEETRFFLVLVCGGVTICVLDKEEINELVDVSLEEDCSISVNLTYRTSMWVRGTHGELRHSIRHSDFPKKIFE